MVETQTRHLLLVTQLLFFFSLAWCLILNHSQTAENDGISFYGVYHQTVPLLIGGYGVAFVGLWRTSTHFKSAGVPTLTWVGLRVIAVLLFVLLATPFNQGAFLDWTHMVAGVLGAIFQLEVALQLVRESRSFRTVLGLAVLLIGGGSPRPRCRTGTLSICSRAKSSFRSDFPGVSLNGPTPSRSA